MKSLLQVDYYTDVLCVWAWIAQRRVDEIEKIWSERVFIRHHYINVFGDTGTRIGKKWSDKGGYAGFGEHVRESAAPYESAPVNPDIWRDMQPLTSATAHMVLKAAVIAKSPDDAKGLAVRLRSGFAITTLTYCAFGRG